MKSALDVAHFKMSQTAMPPDMAMPPDTGMAAEVGFPRIVLRDLTRSGSIKRIDLMNKDTKYIEPVSYSWHQNLGIIMDACEEYARRPV